MVKPSTGSGLESPNRTHIVCVGLTVVVGRPIAEVEVPRGVAAELRTTIIVVTSKTANSNSVKIQLV